ncbi:hypothetical protein GIB67_029377 [Kingdonia uniflora]|uniref:Uncharacterized protein n=1 Tax=Kingdonia uniflora TaxID=39325 RepID=A0A7J7NXR5_9MAGN|nr:hypothetical protein GIB67_029377 [Kingdonia uniflora]
MSRLGFFPMTHRSDHDLGFGLRNRLITADDESGSHDSQILLNPITNNKNLEEHEKIIAGKSVNEDFHAMETSDSVSSSSSGPLNDFLYMKSSEKSKSKKDSAWTKYFDHGVGKVTAVETVDDWTIDLSKLLPRDDENGEMSARLEKQLHREVTLLSRLYHRNVIKLEMVAGTVPYDDMTPIQAVFDVVNMNLRPAIPLNCPLSLDHKKGLFQLIQKFSPLNPDDSSLPLSKDLYKAEKVSLSLYTCTREDAEVPWSGVTTNHSTSPFSKDIYVKFKDFLIEYEVVINRWPQYSLILENISYHNCRTRGHKSSGKQCSDILTQLKDSILKKLGFHVQKLMEDNHEEMYQIPTISNGCLFMSEDEAIEAEEEFYCKWWFHVVILTGWDRSNLNDNIIWVKGNCLQRDDEEPLDIEFRTVKKSVKSPVERKESLLDKVVEEEAELEFVLEGLGLSRKIGSGEVVKEKRRRIEPSGTSGEKVVKERPSAEDNLKVVEKRARLAALQGEEDVSKMVACLMRVVWLRIEEEKSELKKEKIKLENKLTQSKADVLKEMKKLNALKASHAVAIGHLQSEARVALEEVDAIKVDTYVEKEDDEEVEEVAVGVIDGLDGVSCQMVLDNQGDDADLPESDNEKALREMSLKIKDLETGFIRERETSTALLSSRTELQAVSDLTHKVKEKDAEISKGLKELAEITEHAAKLQSRVGTLMVKGASSVRKCKLKEMPVEVGCCSYRGEGPGMGNQGKRNVDKEERRIIKGYSG